LDLDNLTLRQLQAESARALATMEATNDNIYKFNKAAYHNSQNWYKVVIKSYVEKHGDLPSRIGPGTTVKIIMDE
jgi:hypothetical protein